ELDELSAIDFHRILIEPRNSLLRQYQALLATENVTLSFTDEALREIADMAHTVNQSTENIGARRLQTILNTLLDDVLFEAPENNGATVEIDRDAVVERLAGIARDKDLSSYIL
ncbi:MAG: HslU--HslV peptidase ATPase subunit, partial [Candidatus Eisenbacteria bacterium]|nr:HslU--HslV peptidase ATPase subunit [Candidatus Eisenbacteria bacterium]